MSDRPPRPPRAETREIIELRQIKSARPELSTAVDMQIALVDMQRRVQGRVPLPWIQADAAWLRRQHQAGRPIVRFADIPLEWSDFRLTVRQTADVLRRFDAIEGTDHERVVALVREGNALERVVRAWYAATSGVDGRHGANGPPPESAAPSLGHVLVLAIRPFLTRCVEALSQTPSVSSWDRGYCPFCGWEPDFATIAATGERKLICGRCLAQWSFGAWTCPYCANDDRTRITSFATRDGRYRVYACDTCKRYVKAYDGRQAARPVMPAVDTIATLPLDAAAMQRGYT
ncbi:MAG: formate dehydrogenase accessory protein FdhE [Acidobacteria bacterium]|nr:formate dehydrogenase accessory protein FdhE [Acidobacteriota bacterium]